MRDSSSDDFDTNSFLFGVRLFIVLMLIFFSGKFLFNNEIIAFFEGESSEAEQVEGIIVGSESHAVLPVEPAPTRFIDGKTIEKAVPEKGKFIGANLDTMQLFLYEDGVLLKEYELYSIGRPGTRWQTPAGQYEILTKEPNHFSSIGHVWMPYSMQFHGNYFIHGWPYYPDGTDVPPGFSGGCIRLSTSDTKEVYEFAEVGTPFFVYASYDIPQDGGGDLTSETVEEGDGSTLLQSIEAVRGIELKTIAPPTTVTAAAYLVADLDSGQVYAEKNADDVRAIASISKLMTALVANDSIASERIVTVTENAVDTYGNVANLAIGEQMTISEMLYPLLLYSANDAARAIADYYGNDYFASLMNKQARALGMKDSTFVEPAGLSEENVSTANDLFKLARYIHKRKNHIFEITQLESKAIDSVTATNVARSQTFHNIHQLRHMEGYIGGKNGYILASGQTLVTLFKVKSTDGKDRTVAIIVLGSTESTSDSLALLSWLTRSI